MTMLNAPPGARRGRRAPVRTLEVAYTPDSDDAFNFYAWEHGPVRLAGWRARFHRDHIGALNRAAGEGRYHVVNVSSVAYPAVADRYWILATGSSVGRGYGPMLVSRDVSDAASLRGRRVAVADLNTTGGRLAQMYVPGAQFVACPYDQVADAILAGEVDAGVMIHEELVHFPKRGLRLVMNLGAAWTADTKLPLPVGLNLVRRDLGRATAEAVQRACRASLGWALANAAEAMAHAAGFGRGCADAFVPMFSNDDTRRLADDVRAGLAVMFARLEAMGVAPAPKTLEVVDA